MSETTSKTSEVGISAAPVLMKLKKLKPTTKKKTPAFVCVLCQKQFPNQLSLKEHCKQQHTEASPPIDKSIPEKKSNTTTNTVTANLTTISGPISCEFCPQVLPNLSKAIQHKYRKHRFEGKNNFCEFCGRLFPIKIALDQHKESNHLGEMQASKSAAVAAVISAISNTGETTASTTAVVEETPNVNFVCKFCSAPFLTTSALEFHERGVHRFEQNLLLPIFTPPPSTKIKINNNSEVFSVYYCYLCGSEYIMKYNLKKHLQDHHGIAERNLPPQNGLIRCKTCEAIFYTTKAYDAHAIHHRPDDLYVTSEEHRRRVVNRVDQDFDFRRVPQEFMGVPKMMERLRKRKQIDRKKVSQVTAKIAKVSDDESMSPPSSASNSSDEDEEKPIIIKSEVQP